MSMDSPTFDSSPQPPKPGMSSGVKIVLFIVAIFGPLALLCCGGLLLISIKTVRQMQDAVSLDPAVIASVTGEITQIDIPENLQPKSSTDLPIPFTDQKMMTIVTYMGPDNSDTLALVKFGEIFASQGEAQMQQQLDIQLRAQKVGDTPPGNWQEETSQHEVEIRGETVSFDVTKLEDPDAGKSRIQVKGSFQSQSENPTFLILDADTKVVSEEQAIEMLDSIQ